MAITRIDEHLDRDTILALQDLLARAENGQIRGLAFAIKTGPKRHRIGFTGQYWADPIETLGCVTRMEYKLNQLISARDGEPETSTMPL